MNEQRRANIITGRHVLFGMVAFFGIVFAANGALLYWALATHAGIDTPDAYRKGLAYNERIHEADTQNALGWTEGIHLDRNRQRLTIAMSTSSGSPVTDLFIVARVGRPATSDFDFDINPREVRPGRYEADARGIVPGNWVVSFEAMRGPPEARRIVYRAKRRIWLKP
ncbi:MAG: hypothetical protein RLZ98_270 [Pseudomonadota bacterium]|jgi:nitrogen fixation protein FixH